MRAFMIQIPPALLALVSAYKLYSGEPVMWVLGIVVAAVFASEAA